MSTFLDQLAGGRVMLAVAAPAEARAVLKPFDADPSLADRPWTLSGLSDDCDLVVTGVGKTNAAGAVASTADGSVHAGVVSLGVAGALPPAHPAIGTLVLAIESVYADEGMLTPDGFSDCPSMGLALGPFDGVALTHDRAWVDALRAHADRTGRIATVSTCSGTDASAAAVVRRTGAIAESMEGAAVAHVAARLALRSAEIRAISNTTGDRPSQTWDLSAALAALTRLVADAFVR